MNIKAYFKIIITLLLALIFSFICSIGTFATVNSTMVEPSTNDLFGIATIEELSDEDPYPPDIAFTAEPVTVYTNSHKPVDAYKCTEGYSFGWKATVRQIYLSDNNLSEYSYFSGEPSTCYNCHSYAWYNRSENNNIWINYPDVFINQDKHCIPISRNELQEGDIVVCIGYDGKYSHSAVVENIYSDGTIECVSKCGNKGLFLHDLDYLDTMYPNIGMEYYRYTPGEHLIRYNTISANQHYVDCEASDCNYYELHDTTAISINNNRHRLECDECGYLVYENHNLYISDIYNDVYTIECRDCTYSISCNCDREYVSDGSSGHYYNCLEGCFSEFESHTYELTGEYDNYNHEIECIYCGYSEYVDHDLYMYSADTEDYVVKCRDCTYTVECWEEPDYYGDSEDGHSVDCPCGCYSFFEPHTPGSYSSTEEGYHNVVCADCGYIYSEDCNYGSSTSSSNSSYHFYECTDCGYERAESHVFFYTQIVSDNHVHNAYCGICKTPYSKPHNWVSVIEGYECSDCGKTTLILPNYSSLSDDELELLLSSMSADELEAFLASLPEDDLARVTAILPPDDDELVTE